MVGLGAPAKSGRLAYGALLIKECLGITDEETVEQICENPYLQYLLGFKELCKTAPFDSLMMIHFRSRLTTEHHDLINSKIIAVATSSEEQDVEAPTDDDDGSSSNGSKKSGKLLVDATCTPVDIL